MTFDITTDGTTTFSLSPLSHYVAVVEGVFGGATVIVKSAGGVLYLPWREGDATIALPDASEFRAVSAGGEIVVASASGTTALKVSISKVSPTC